MLSAAIILAITSTTLAPPDVVLVVVDDLGWADLSCMPDGRHDTPALDALAARGTLFTQATANAPNCAPARAALMTGQWTTRHGIFTVGPSKRGKADQRLLEPPVNRTSLPTAAHTLAERLQAAGWDTAHVGKWHLGDDPCDHGFDLNVGGTKRGHPKSYMAPYRNTALPDGPDGEYLTDRLTNEAVSLLQAPRDAPLFLYLPYYAVHTPLQAPSEAIDATLQANPSWSRRRAVYDCMVRRTDSNIGRLLEHVGPDTLVLVCSDHGGAGRIAHNGYLRGCKGQLYEGGIRTPLLVAGPGVQPGAVCDTPVSLHELAPTISATAGLPHDAAFDGRSLWPLLEGDVDVERGPQYWHFPAYLEAAGTVPGPFRTTPVSAIRVGDWKLLHFHEHDRLELYDLHADPSESVDICTRRPNVARAMYVLLDEWRMRTGARMPRTKADS